MATDTTAEFSEPFYGLHSCVPRERKGRIGGRGEGKRFWVEADAAYLSREATKRKCGDGGADSCWWTVVAGWYFLVVHVWKSVENGLNGEVDSGVRVARAGT